MVGDALDFLVEGSLIQLHKFNGNPIGLQLPAQVELKVAYSEPGARGNTSGDVTKLARLETGLEIKVPLYIQEGEKVRVYTETREFAGRAGDFETATSPPMQSLSTPVQGAHFGNLSVGGQKDISKP